MLEATEHGLAGSLIHLAAPSHESPPASECAALQGRGGGCILSKVDFLLFFSLLIHNINSLRERANTLSIFKKSNQELSMKDINGKKP